MKSQNDQIAAVERAEDVEEASDSRVARPEKHREQPGRRVNEKFQDVNETGKWGAVSRKEIYAVVALITVIVIAVIVIIVVMLTGSESDPAGTNSNVTTSNVQGFNESNVSPTTVDPVDPMTPSESYEILREALEGSALTKDYLDMLPERYDELNNDNTVEGSEEESVVNAAIFATESSSNTNVNTVTSKFALAHLYYETNGGQWENNKNWMSSEESICDWHGITCNLASREIEEIDLANNGLVGDIPLSLSLLQSLRVLWFNGNRLTGNIPGDLFANLPSLFILYLQNNMLTGGIPSNLQANQVLRTFYIQGNNLTGIWPVNYCPDCDAQNRCNEHPFLQFGLNCMQTPCTLRGCCDIEKNCYM